MPLTKETVTNAIDALERQGKFAKTDTGGCSYILEKGCYCIVGHMMPDDAVRIGADSYENSSIEDLVAAEFPWAKDFTENETFFLMQLQYEHDHSIEFEKAIANMRDITDKYFC